MIGGADIGSLLRYNRLRKKGVTVQSEKLLRATMFLARIRDSSPNAHVIRLRYAKKICDLVESFIVEEVTKATTKPKTDPTSMSWTDVGQTLDIGRSVAYRRYGEKK